ncbi:hypothetical protein Tco_0104170 [Tanacetum coccineum]
MRLILTRHEFNVSLTESTRVVQNKEHEKNGTRNEHLASEEIEKLVEDTRMLKRVHPTHRQRHHLFLALAILFSPVNVDDEEDEITDEVFELRRRVKGKNVEETRISPIPSPIKSPRNLSTLVSSDTEKLQELTVTHPTPSSSLSAPKGRYGYLFTHLKKRFMPRTSSDQLADNLHDVMMETLPSLVKEKVTEQVKKEVPAQISPLESKRSRDLEAPALSLIKSTFFLQKAGSRSSKSVVIQDTPSAHKPKPATLKPKLKSVQTLTPKEQEAPDVMQDLKESKKTSSRQSGTRGSSKGTGRIPGDPDESTVISATSSEGNEDLNEKEDIDCIDFEEDDEKKDDTDDDKSIDLEMTDDEETDDEVLQGKEQVYDYEDEEMLNVEVEDSGKGNAEVFDAAKADAEKTKEAKDDSKKAKLPPTSSNLSISSGFGDQFLKLSSDTSLIGTVKDTTNAKISSLLDIKIQSEVPHIQSPSMLKVPVSVISKLSVLTPVQETASAALFQNWKGLSELKKIDHSTKALATLKSQVPTIVEQYLGSKIDDDLQKIPTEKSASEILNIKKEQAEKQKMPKYTIKSTDKASLKEYDQKTLIEDENAMDKGVADIVKDHKQKHDDDDDKMNDEPSSRTQPILHF